MHGLSSWGSVAAAADDLVDRNFRRHNEASDADERAFLGWEVLTAGVEIAEIAATVIRHVREPEASRFHSADNRALKTLFNALAEDGFSSTEAFAFLRLRRLAGFSRPTVRAMWATGAVVENLREAVKGLSQFWLMQAENARWFRHLPMSLTVDEAAEVSNGHDPSHDFVAATITATPNRLETLAVIDEDTHQLTYTALRREDVHAARIAANVASQIVMNWFANAEKKDDPRPDQRWLLPFLTRRLSDAEKKVLEEHGRYTLAERIPDAR